MAKLPVILSAGGDRAVGTLNIERPGDGAVVFARSPGGPRESLEDRILSELEGSGLVTLDVRVPPRTGISQSARFLSQAVHWLITFLASSEVRLPVALFGTGDGADAALLAAIRLGTEISSVVCHEGRPDRVVGLERLRTPALFLLSGADESGLARYFKTAHLMPSAELIVIAPPEANVSDRSISWLEGHFRPRAAGETAG